MNLTRNTFSKGALAAAIVAAMATFAFDAVAQSQPIRNVVLVHGAFADGSGWRGVYDELKGRGFQVTIVQNPLTSLDDDVAATKRALDRQNAPRFWSGTHRAARSSPKRVSMPRWRGLSMSRRFRLMPEKRRRSNMMVSRPHPSSSSTRRQMGSASSAWTSSSLASPMTRAMQTPRSCGTSRPRSTCRPSAQS